MERLRIKNFLIIEDADFEVGRFNVIIGSQASGKSIIAKLLYFFRIYYQFSGKGKQIISQQFENIFPKYTWEAQAFEIYYQIDDIEIRLSNDGELKAYCSKSPVIQKAFFIPANRSSIPFIQDNIFSLLQNNAEIDFFIKVFGSYYEQEKKSYTNHRVRNKSEPIENIVKNILKGEYIYASGQDWIKNEKEQLIHLSNTSSGQQESLPMLVVLSGLANYLYENISIIIEELEVHLFPVSQKRIIELLSLLYNKHHADFVLTTHSPYIPTAINCAILAHDVINREGEDAVKNIFNPNFAIKYEDVRAYTIENGHLKSILNNELRLISASVIDSVSDEFENVFSSLLAL